jgi:hypothetical protein
MILSNTRAASNNHNVFPNLISRPVGEGDRRTACPDMVEVPLSFFHEQNSQKRRERSNEWSSEMTVKRKRKLFQAPFINSHAHGLCATPWA